MQVSMKIFAWHWHWRGRLLARTVSLTLLVIAALIGRSLVINLTRPSALAAQIEVPISPAIQWRLNHTFDTTKAADVHLFGMPAISTLAAPVVALSNLNLLGILYSTSADESRAIVSIGGETVTINTGARLPNGDLVAGISEDRIFVDQGGIIVSVLLDIKKADPDAHFERVALTGDGTATILASYAPMSALPDEADKSSAPPFALTSGAISEPVAHGQFLSVSAIRGNTAVSRFSGIRPPISSPQTSRPHGDK